MLAELIGEHKALRIAPRYIGKSSHLVLCFLLFCKDVHYRLSRSYDSGLSVLGGRKLALP